jgi:hypothetical protein
MATRNDSTGLWSFAKIAEEMDEADESNKIIIIIKNGKFLSLFGYKIF